MLTKWRTATLPYGGRSLRAPFSAKWIRCEVPFPWPLHSAELTPLDLGMWMCALPVRAAVCEL